MNEAVHTQLAKVQDAVNALVSEMCKLDELQSLNLVGVDSLAEQLEEMMCDLHADLGSDDEDDEE